MLKYGKNVKWLPFTDDFLWLIPSLAYNLRASPINWLDYISSTARPWTLATPVHSPVCVMPASSPARSIRRAYTCQIIVVQNGMPSQSFDFVSRKILLVCMCYWLVIHVSCLSHSSKWCVGSSLSKRFVLPESCLRNAVGLLHLCCEQYCFNEQSSLAFSMDQIGSTSQLSSLCAVSSNCSFRFVLIFTLVLRYGFAFDSVSNC